MFKRLKNIFYRFAYALPFGMKAADAEIFGDKGSIDGSSVVIQQQKQSNNLGEALLQGQVTQEVEELRYSTYKVAKEADNYEYLGEGVAVKKKNTANPTVFTFRNKVICESVGHELNRVGKYSTDRYVLKVTYKDVPRFKIEKYCNNVKVDLNEKNITLYFEKNTKEPEIRMFYNELERILDGKRSEIISYPSMIEFVTNNTFIQYKLKNLSYKQLINEEFQYVLTYNFKEYEEEDFVEKFHSKTQEEKYQNKERKNKTIVIGDGERKCYCSMCGKEINSYDADVTEQTFGYSLCNECLTKVTDLQEKFL